MNLFIIFFDKIQVQSIYCYWEYTFIIYLCFHLQEDIFSLARRYLDFKRDRDSNNTDLPYAAQLFNLFSFRDLFYFLMSCASFNSYKIQTNNMCEFIKKIIKIKKKHCPRKKLLFSFMGATAF